MTTIAVTRWTVSPLPEDMPNGIHFQIHVEYVGNDRWAVRRGSFYLSRRGRWDREPMPSSRTDAWKRSHCFTEDGAKRLAAKHASLIEINGRTVDQWLAEWRASQDSQA